MGEPKRSIVYEFAAVLVAFSAITGVIAFLTGFQKVCYICVAVFVIAAGYVLTHESDGSDDGCGGLPGPVDDALGGWGL